MTGKRHYDAGEERLNRLSEEAQARHKAQKNADESLDERVRKNIEKHGA